MAARRTLRSVVTALAVASACASGLASAPVEAATGSVSIALSVSSATTLDVDDCATGAGGRTEFGTILPGVPLATPLDCEVLFGSSNSTARLELGQADGVGSAMWSVGDGTLDAGFAAAGQRVDSLGTTDDGAAAVAVDAAGRTVVASYSYIASHDEVVLTRYLPDGTGDPTFGSAGRVTTDLTPDHDRPADLAIDGSGRIVVVGDATGTDPDVLVARFLPTGVLDPAFGSGGVVRDAIGGAAAEKATCVALRPGGAVVVGGFAEVAAVNRLAVAAYADDGSRDTSFGTGGVTSTPIGVTESYGKGCALQDDGRLVVAGQAGSATDSDAFVARFTTAGALDPTYDGDGWRRTPVVVGAADEAMAVDLDLEGRAVVSGSARVGAFDQLAVLRYTTGGALDASFSSDGMATWAFGSGSSVGRAVLALPDGTIAVVGDAVVGGSQDVAVARIQGSGALEGGFGTGGLRTVAVRADSDLARDIALGADGELVVAGQSWAPGAALDAAVLTFASARIDQYAGGSRDWTSGAFFGACLRSAGSAVADWGHRVDDTCPTSHGSWWRAVPATATPVAHTTGIGTTTLALRFGVRADAAQARGRYVAPLAFTVIAPG